MRKKLNTFLNKCYNNGFEVELVDTNPTEKNINYYYGEDNREKLLEHIFKDKPVGVVVDDLGDRAYITYTNKNMITLMV